MTTQESRLAIVIDVGDAERRIRRLREQLRELGGQADDTSDDLGNLGDNANNAGNGAGNLTSNSDKAKKSLDNMAKAAVVAGAALAGAVGLSIKKAIDFESTIASVSKVVDATLATSIDDIANGLKKLSTQIPLSVNELGEIAAAGGQLGVTADDLLGYVETVSKMAVAFDMTAANAGESMAVLSNVLQKPIDQMAAIGDMINEVSNSTPAAASDIISALKDVGGAFTAFGIADDFAVALTGTMIAVGEESGRASNALTSMLTTFGTLDIATKRQLGGFEQLGINVDNFSQLMKVDAQQAIMDFSESLRQIPAAERLGVATKIFGRDYALAITKTINANELFGETLKSIELDANGVSAALGSMEKEYQAISATTANKMTLFKNNIDQAAISLGEVFIPALNELLLNMTPLIAVIGTWVAANPELVKQIVVISGALLGSIVGLKLAVDGFTAMKNTVDGLKLAYTALGSTMGLTVIGLGILLAAGVLVYQNWDEIKRVVSENQPMFIALGVSVSALTVALIAANAPLILLKVQAAAAAVQAGVMAVATAGWSVAAGVAAAATWTFNAALAVLTSPILLVVGAIALIAAGGYLVVKNWAAISAGLNAEFNKIKNYVLNTVASMQAAWDRGVANTRGAIINIKNTIVTTLKELPSRMLQIGKDIVIGLVNGIKSGASGVTTAISSMASSAVVKAKSVLDIRSPSRVMKKVGEQTAEGMAKGIKKGAKAVKSEAQKMAEQAVAAVKTGVENLKREMALFGNDSPVAALKYDISVGKFGGADTSQLMSLTQTKEQLELSKKLADANKSVQDSIDGLIKQQALFGNNSSLASLMYDIEHTEKYKGVTQELTDKLIEQTRALEQLGMTAKATDAIRARFAQLEKDREKSGDALLGVMGEIKEETPLGKIQADYDRRIGIIEEYEKTHTDMLENAKIARLAIEQSYMDAKQQIMLGQGEALFGNLAGLSKAFLGEQSSLYRGLFAIEKGYTLASVLLKNKEAISKAWASAPFPYNLAAVASTVAGTAGLASAVSGIMPKGFKQGGYTGNMGASQVAGVVHGQEYVFDAQATKRIGVDNLNAMRRGDSPKGGGDVIINNYSSAKIEQRQTADGVTILDVRDEVKRSWTSLSNPNSFESKQVNRNVQAPRRRGA